MLVFLKTVGLIIGLFVAFAAGCWLLLSVIREFPDE